MRKDVSAMCNLGEGIEEKGIAKEVKAIIAGRIWRRYREGKNIMDSFIEALYGRSEETIPEEYDWFAPLLGDWEFDYKDKFIDGDRSRP